MFEVTGVSVYLHSYHQRLNIMHGNMINKLLYASLNICTPSYEKEISNAQISKANEKSNEDQIEKEISTHTFRKSYQAYIQVVQNIEIMKHERDKILAWKNMINQQIFYVSKLEPEQLANNESLQKDMKSEEHICEKWKMYLDIILETNMETFKDCPNENISAEDFARAGFIYESSFNIVICCFCQIFFSNCEKIIDPVFEHERTSPHCPMLKMLNRQKEYQGESHKSTISKADIDNMIKNVNILTKDFHEKMLYAYDRTQMLIDYFENCLLENFSDFFYFNRADKSHSVDASYCVHSLRMKTFDTWAYEEVVSKAVLAEAGFLYTGAEDSVMCYCCEIVLKDWQKGDNPWKEHAVWSPNCVFLKSFKDKEYRLNGLNTFLKRCYYNNRQKIT